MADICAGEIMRERGTLSWWVRGSGEWDWREHTERNYMVGGDWQVSAMIGDVND